MIYLQTNSKAMEDGEKEGRTKVQKYEYRKNKKRFLDELKNIFHSFERAIIW